jgi:threonine aldolase
MEAVAQVAHRSGIPVHLDGARIFNAAVALAVPAAKLACHADSVAFSLCKGLACPVGSLLCGSGEFIERARKYRKMVGGGMRQAGIIAAAGIVALGSMIDRLQEDHDNARLLAQGLAGLPSLRLDPASGQSNMVSLQVEGIPALEFQGRLREAGVLVTYMGGQRLRLVTHYGIERADIKEAIQRIRGVAGGLT